MDAVSNIRLEFLNSPQFETSFGGELFGGSLVNKIETINPIRSFKARGAQNLVAHLPASCPLVTVTAGNFSQGLAYAARERDCSITIFAKCWREFG